jgi:hypothetical protein
MLNNILKEIATPSSIYYEIMMNIITPNYHLIPELISEISIGFLTNQKSVNKSIEEGWFKYYFIRTCTNQIKSSTSGFHKNTRIKDFQFIDNLEIIDDNEIELKEDKEEKFKLIDKIYTTIPKTYFQEYLWHEYFLKGKTHRQIGKENDISHCLSFHEIKKIKTEIINKIPKTI